MELKIPFFLHSVTTSGRKRWLILMTTFLSLMKKMKNNPDNKSTNVQSATLKREPNRMLFNTFWVNTTLGRKRTKIRLKIRLKQNSNLWLKRTKTRSLSWGKKYAVQDHKPSSAAPKWNRFKIKFNMFSKTPTTANPSALWMERPCLCSCVAKDRSRPLLLCHSAAKTVRNRSAPCRDFPVTSWPSTPTCANCLNSNATDVHPDRNSWTKKSTKRTTNSITQQTRGTRVKLANWNDSSAKFVRPNSFPNRP